MTQKYGEHSFPVARAVLTRLTRANNRIDFEAWHRAVSEMLGMKTLNVQNFITVWFELVSHSDLTSDQRIYLCENFGKYAQSLFSYHTPYYYVQMMSVYNTMPYENMYLVSHVTETIVTKDEHSEINSDNLPVVSPPYNTHPSMTFPALQHDGVFSDEGVDSTHINGSNVLNVSVVSQTDELHFDVEIATVSQLKAFLQDNGLSSEGIVRKNDLKKLVVDYIKNSS